MEQYKENNLSHQDPVFGISQWQTDNDYADDPCHLQDLEDSWKRWEEEWGKFADKENILPPDSIVMEPEERKKKDDEFQKYLDEFTT